MSTKPSLKAVAEAAGVGYGTASRALSGKGYVSAATRRKVEEAAQQLNYRPSVLAKALREDRTNLVGVIVPTLLNEFYSDAMQVIQAELAQAGYQMIVSAAGTAEQQDQAVESLIQHRVAGIIQVPVIGATPTQEVPLVQLNRFNLGEGIPAVVADDEPGFFDLGNRVLPDGGRAGVLLGEEALTTTQARLRGLCRAAAQRDCELVVRYGEYTADSGYRLTSDLLAGGFEHLDLIVVASPRLMAGSVRYLVEHEIDVPHDIELAGYDDPEWYRFFGPGITAFVPPHKEMGATVTQLLLDAIDNAIDPEIRHLPGTLIVRGSAG